MPASSEQRSVNVYVRPFLALPERSARNAAVRSPVICQSAAVAPSLPVIWTIRQEALQLSAGAAFTDTAVMLPLGGHKLLGEAATLVMLASGNECGDSA